MSQDQRGSQDQHGGDSASLAPTSAPQGAAGSGEVTAAYERRETFEVSASGAVLQAQGIVDVIGKIGETIDQVGRVPVEIYRSLDLAELKLMAEDTRLCLHYGNSAATRAARVFGSIADRFGSDAKILTMQQEDGTFALAAETTVLCNRISEQVRANNVEALLPLLIEWVPRVIDLIGRLRRR